MKYFIFLFVFTCVFGCSRKHENESVSTSGGNNLRILKYTEKLNNLKTFKIDSTIVSQCGETNVDTNFIRSNLLKIDYYYRRDYSKYSMKYLDIHIIDTIQKDDNTLFISFFESYTPPKLSGIGPYYAIKLMIVEADVVISVTKLAEYQDFYFGYTSLSSSLIPGNRIITNEVSHSCSCSDVIREDETVDCRTLYRTQYLFYDKKNKKFKLVLQKDQRKEG